MSTISALTALAASAAAADDQTVVDDTSATATKKIAFSELLDAILRVADAGDVLMLDATAGKLVVRQRGGTADTDEVQIYHDGTNAKIVTMSGRMDFEAAALANFTATFGGGTKTVQIETTYGVIALDTQGGIKFAPGNAGPNIIYGGDANTIQISNGVQGSGAVRDLAARTLIARQDGGVVGTDEVQTYHDGANGYFETKSGAINLRLSGFNPLSIDASLATFNVAIQSATTYPLSNDAYDLGLTGTRWRNLFLSGYSLCTTLVEANTAGSGSPNILTATESRTALTNEGATAENYHTLPTAAAGLDFEFVCQDSDGIRVTANTGDTIRDVGTVSASAGYIRSSTVGSVIRLKAINATEWFVVYKQGTWTVDS